MFGLGKTRSELGKFVDRYRISQKVLSKASGVNLTTISKLCNDPSYIPTIATQTKIVRALESISEMKLERGNFW